VKTGYITISHPNVIAEFSANVTSGDPPLTVFFTDQSTGSPTSWAWNFGDSGTSTSRNPSHSYSSPGSYTVSLTAANPGNSDTETKTNYINIPPQPNFSANLTSGNVPLTVNFTNQTIGTVSSYSWNFGDGGTSSVANPSHTYNSAGSFTVSLTVTGAGGTKTETKANYIVTTFAGPVANFYGSPTSGTVPLSVSFTNTSSGDISSYSWNFGDGSSSSLANPSHTYNSAGTFSVSLTVTGPGGSDSETKSGYITVTNPGDPPIANFYGSPTSGSYPLTVTFTNISTGDISSYSWNFGDGASSTLENPTYTYNSAGTYSVSLTVTGPGGSDSETKSGYITVTNPGDSPVANFTANPTSGSYPLTVTFTNISTGDISSYNWNFGDGASSTLENPTYTYNSPGNYSVSLTVSGPDGNDTEYKQNLISVGSNVLQNKIYIPLIIY
jgi:PKD repeat protein